MAAAGALAIASAPERYSACADANECNATQSPCGTAGANTRVSGRIAHLVVRDPQFESGVGLSISREFAQDYDPPQRSTPRAMISRWMSEVPSSISSSFASLIHFSTGYSRE